MWVITDNYPSVPCVIVFMDSCYLDQKHRNITKAMGALWDENVNSRVQNAIASHGCSGSRFRAGDGAVRS